MSAHFLGRTCSTIGAALLAFVATPGSFAQNAPAANTSQGCSREEYDLNADCAREVARPKQSPRESAPIDLTGYWVSIVSEEWRWRMMTPPKGDRASIPLNQKARDEMNKWDPKDPQQCKAFGAAGMIRNPMRARFSWVDDNHLRLETDHGQVTRDFHFGGSRPANGAPSMQGDSVASWEGGALKVVTTNLAPGFLRKNGVPYSDQTVLTEYFDRYSAAGKDFVTVTTIVSDPMYLTRDFIVTTDFKLLADGSAWRPTPCDAPLVVSSKTRT
ncbi:MAG: hypothetical protein SXG53_14280 [Pseudomonadota bacterium]|nr:hypothetical protein [Pseudomonadota bacterium]